MKKITLLIMMALLTMLLVAKTTQINNFEDLMKDLKKGESIRIVAEYGKCKLISGNEEKTAPMAIGGLNIDVWEYFAPMSIGNPEAFVVFSSTKLINYGGYIYNYAKVKITEKGKVIITAQYANSQTFEIEMNEKFFTEINDGKNDGAFFLYKQN